MTSTLAVTIKADQRTLAPKSHMKLTAIRLKNFRTIEELSLSFPDSYAAICGPNDSGKTNVLRALRVVMKVDDESPYYQGDDDGLSVKDDYPKWLDTSLEQREINIELDLLVFSDRDAGPYQFLVRQLQLIEPPTALPVTLRAVYRAEKQAPEVSVTCQARKFDGIEAQEVFKRFQTSRSILFHDSPQNELMRLRYREGLGSLRDVSGDGAAALAKLKKDLEKGLGKIAKGHQQELERLLGRLETKYKVGLTLPPKNVSLAEWFNPSKERRR